MLHSRASIGQGQDRYDMHSGILGFRFAFRISVHNVNFATVGPVEPFVHGSQGKDGVSMPVSQQLRQP